MGIKDLFRKKDKKQDSGEQKETVREKQMNELQQVLRDAFQKNLKLLSEDFETEEMSQLFKAEGNYVVKNIGAVNISSGFVEVGDPLCYLGTNCALQLKRQIKPGRYPIFLSIYSSPIWGLRYLAAKMQITDKKPIKYEEALPIQDDSGLNLFGVETGLACFCDVETEKQYIQFLHKWHNENPEGNHYDNYFADFFAESAKREPEYQRTDGDYLNWNLPNNDDCNIVMFCSGFGDGAYSAYWGYDENEDVCCLILRFIDPKAFEIES